jgi:hypothetical protein
MFQTHLGTHSRHTLQHLSYDDGSIVADSDWECSLLFPSRKPFVMALRVGDILPNDPLCSCHDVDPRSTFGRPGVLH